MLAELNFDNRCLGDALVILSNQAFCTEAEPAVSLVTHSHLRMVEVVKHFYKIRQFKEQPKYSRKPSILGVLVDRVHFTTTYKVEQIAYNVGHHTARTSHSIERPVKDSSHRPHPSRLLLEIVESAALGGGVD